MRANCGYDHPWRQYAKRAARPGPTAREIAVAEVMAYGDKQLPGGRTVPITAHEIADRLGLKPSNVRNIMVQICRRMGPQAR